MEIPHDDPPPYITLEKESTQKNDATKPALVVDIDPEPEPLIRAGFEDDNARVTFILKVLSIVLIQVMTTGVIIESILAADYIWFDISRNRTPLIAIASLLHLSTYIALFYCTDARKQKPYIYMFLAALPLTTGFSIVVFTCRYILPEIGIAWFFYVIAVLAQMMYAIFCLDGALTFRSRNGIFLTAGILVFFYAITAPILPLGAGMSPITLFYVTLLVFAECSVLAYRLRVMTSHHYHYTLSSSDYVEGALCLYTETPDIVCRFWRTKVAPLFILCRNKISTLIM